jgi:MarR family transcriptional regulator for hemolysin
MIIHDFSIIVRQSRIFCEHKLHYAGIDIGFPAQSVLMYLAAYDQVNQDTVARHFMIDKGAIAKTISKLEENSFVRRWENPENKREKLLSLTDKGSRTIDRMQEVLLEWQQTLYRGLDPEQIKTIEELAGILTANAIKSGKQYV